MQTGHRRPSETQLLEMLECEEFYRILRDKEITERDTMAIQEFTSKTLTNAEWDDFQKYCLENQIDPFKEMREIIYSTYAKVLKSKTS
jgi:hypothetical protein